jgi:hypothetical protein
MEKKSGKIPFAYSLRHGQHGNDGIRGPVIKTTNIFMQAVKLIRLASMQAMLGHQERNWENRIARSVP